MKLTDETVMGGGAGPIATDRLFEAAIVVPARNEAKRLPGLLTRLAAESSVRSGKVLLVIVANNCDDGTAPLARSVCQALGVAPVVADISFASGGVGAARRVGASLALARLRPEGVLISTDADCLPARDWLEGQRALLTHHDCVCGRAMVGPDDPLATPSLLFQQALEWTYLRKMLRLARRIDPLYHAGNAHFQAGGASLALTRAAYEAVGGFAPLTSGEDGDLVARVTRAGYSVCHSAAVRVFASPRVTGRAPNGMAEWLRAREGASDPAVDPNLETVAATVRRARAASLCRAMVAGSGAGRAQIARALGLGDGAALARDGEMNFAALWQAVQRLSPHLMRAPMTLSGLVPELSRLNDALAGIPLPAEPAAFVDDQRAAVSLCA